MKSAISILGSITSVAVLLGACGGNNQTATISGTGPQPGAGGSGTAGFNPGTSGVFGGGSGGVIGIAGMHDGGTTPLTSSQVTQIEMSACAGTAIEGENLPSVLELVVDTSLSMNDIPTGSTQTKWQLTQAALGTAVDSLSSLSSVGVLFFPNQKTQAGTPNDVARDVSACVNVSAMVPIGQLGALGSAQRTLLHTSLNQAGPNGSTPTHDAYRYALINGIDQFMTSDPKFMLLITDGIPTFSLNCEGTGTSYNPAPTQPVIDEIAGAFATGVRTFVIGSPGSEEGPNGVDERGWLSAAARAGGTALAGCSDSGPNYCHMDMTQTPDFGASLAQGLAEIAGQIDICNYTIPDPSGMTIDLSKVNVIATVNGSDELIQPDNVGDCSEGWQFNSQGQVVLCGSTCSRVRADAGAKVELLFGCAPGDVEIPPK
jgi:hypothetical protein